MRERLEKVIARSGFCSRREAKNIILSGRVSVNSNLVKEPGFRVDLKKDKIQIDNKNLKPFSDSKKVYILLNKPVKVLSTVKDPRGRKTVIDLIPEISARLYPAGRLDWDSTGLLLLTNDGELTYKLTHPSFEVPKVYRVKVRGVLSEEELSKIERGVKLKDGFISKGAKARILRASEKYSWLELTLTEGKNREVRRIFDALSHTVVKLERVAIGPLRLGKLPRGGYRFLSKKEVRLIKSFANSLKPRKRSSPLETPQSSE